MMYEKMVAEIFGSQTDLNLAFYTLKNVKADSEKGENENVLFKLVFEREVTVSEAEDVMKQSTPIVREPMKIIFAKSDENFLRTIEIGELDAFAASSNKDAAITSRLTFITQAHLDELLDLFSDFLPMRLSEMTIMGRVLRKQEELRFSDEEAA